MNQHLREEDIIKYEFQLLTESRKEQVEEHMEGCEVCRAECERVRGKFAALEALREESKASEGLIAQTLAQVQKTQATRKVNFRRQGWLQAAAAIIVVGGIGLMLWRVNPDVFETPRVEQEQRRSQEKQEVAGEPGGRRGGMVEVEAEVADEPMVVAATPPVARLGAGSEAAEGYVPEEPPFAPASNIELTVLPRRENVQLSIYNSADLTLVRDRRQLTMKRGWNWLQFSWEGTLIDPTSLSLAPQEQGDKITVEQLVFPPRWKNLGRWLIKSEVTGQVPFEITYLTSGLNWRAFYMGTLNEDETAMRLEGYVRVNNGSGEDYEEAQTRLIVGKVHLLDAIAELAKRAHPYLTPLPMPVDIDDYSRWKLDAKVDFEEAGDKSFLNLPTEGMNFYGGFGAGKPKEIVKEGLSEYFLYTIEGRETIPNEWGKRLPSFEADDIPVESLYKYDEEQWGEQTVRFVTFVNDEEHELGETPIPEGEVKIYGTADEEGHLKYVGGTGIKYIPVNEEVELNLGAAREVKVEPVLMESRTENYEFEIKTGIQPQNISFNVEEEIAGWERVETWKIKVNNTRMIPVEVEITRGFGTSLWELEIIEGQVSGNKHDVYQERFEMRVEPQREHVFIYKVRTYYGTRERVPNQIKVNEKMTNELRINK